METIDKSLPAILRNTLVAQSILGAIILLLGSFAPLSIAAFNLAIPNPSTRVVLTVAGLALIASSITGVVMSARNRGKAIDASRSSKSILLKLSEAARHATEHALASEQSFARLKDRVTDEELARLRRHIDQATRELDSKNQALGNLEKMTTSLFVLAYASTIDLPEELQQYADECNDAVIEAITSIPLPTPTPSIDDVISAFAAGFAGDPDPGPGPLTAFYALGRLYGTTQQLATEWLLTARSASAAFVVFTSNPNSPAIDIAKGAISSVDPSPANFAALLPARLARPADAAHSQSSSSAGSAGT
jgi:hypothetical protein